MNSFNRGSLSISLATVLLGAAAQSQAQQALSNLNSSVMIDLTHQRGMFNWTVDGNNYLNQQWFWYRVGSSGPQFSIDTLNLTSVNNTGSALFTTYTDPNNRFSINLDYTLTGSTPGSGHSDIGESIVINNTSGGALDFHFFQFSHITLAGGPNTVTLGPTVGNYHEAFQSGGDGSALTENVDTVTTPGANHGEAAVYPQTLNNLNTVNGYTLNDHTTATGDVTWGFEWDKSIATGGSFSINKDKSLTVPEPSSLSLLAAGLALGIGYARRRSATQA